MTIITGTKSLTNTRLYTLDALRGIAALVVVAFHYSNFFTVGNVLPPSFEASNLPFYLILRDVYKVGWLAVDLFFTLSGFVFFWLYADKIAKREITSQDFWLLRFSRLYPLHLLTLLIVVCGQWLISLGNAHFFVYPNNDLKQFIMQLCFVSAWGGDINSFNGPVWSVSIEVAVYGLFFLFCRFFRIRIVILLAVAVIGLWIVFRFHNFMGRGIGSFFIGGAVYIVYTYLTRLNSARVTFLLFSVMVGLWAFWIVALHTDWAFLSSYLHKRIPRYFPVVFLFPLTIVVLAMLEPYIGNLKKRLAILGDISYSLYLLHFPLQLSVAVIVSAIGVPLNIMYSSVAFILFFAVLIPLAYFCYHYFERPCQQWIRSKSHARI